MKNLIATAMVITVTTLTVWGLEKATVEKKTQMAEMTAEQRETMATKHEKLATCLRSGKLMGECREEMMGVEDCSMMGMKHGKGMMEGYEKKRNK